MKIWLLQIGEPVPIPNRSIKKLRTALLADELARMGHQITWWTSAFDHSSKKWLVEREGVMRVSDNIELFFLKGCGYPRNFSIKRFVDHRLLAKRFRTFAGNLPKPDLILPSFPSYDLACEAVVFAKNHGIPSIVDVRDMWPDIFLDKIPPALHGLGRIILSSEFAIATRCLSTADCLYSMMGSVLDWALAKAARQRSPFDRIFYLGAPKRPLITSAKFGRISEFKKKSGSLVVSFVGTFGHYYQPSILTEVARSMQGKPILFVLGGNGDFFSAVKKACSGLPNVMLTGWLSESEMAYALSLSDVGVIVANIKTHAFPNKAFMYMAVGLPIISGLEGDLKEIISANGIGLYYEPGDTRGLENAIARLYEDRKLLSDMKTRVNELFKNRFNATRIYKDYADAIVEFAEKRACVGTAK